jgi:hypothetical protein
VQSLQVAPWIPQEESSRPELQLPFASQHPMHVAAQLLLPSSPEMTVLPSSDDDASSLDPAASSSPVGLFRPGPVLVGIGAASTGPASCVGVCML